VPKQPYDEASQCGKKYEKKVWERSIFHGNDCHDYKSYKHTKKRLGADLGGSGDGGNGG